MDFGFTAAEERLRQDVVDFLKKEVTPEIVAEQQEFFRNYNQFAPLTNQIIKKIGAKGWLVPHWPEKWGGLGMSHIATFIVQDELAYAHLPDIYMGAHWAGPPLMKVGSEAQKQEFLLPLARGEVEFAVAYTEPEAGCDLASLQLRAVDKGDHFVLNGQKLYTSSARFARYAWMAARTDWQNPRKHQGITIFIIDLKGPGVTVKPLPTMGDFAVNEVFIDDVRVDKKYQVGELNRGFYYMMAALDYERIFPVGWWRRLYEELLDYTREEKRDGKPLGQDPLVRQKLARIGCELEATRLLYYRVGYLMDKGELPAYQCAMEKMFISEFSQHLANVGMQVMGLYGQLKKDSKYAPLRGEIELNYRRTICETIVAGTTEIQRNVIALRGLNLPAA
jgi:alkylation response protein AidB-like acyl-CoA dehydrogenase